MQDDALVARKAHGVSPDRLALYSGRGQNPLSEPIAKILIVEPDPQTLEMLVAAFVERFNAHITCVSTAEDALNTELVEPHDIIVTELELDGMDGIELAEQLASLRRRPIIILAEDPTSTEAIYAMRAGVTDMFEKPFRVSTLLDSASRALHSYDIHCKHIARHRKLRDVVRKVIRERRELAKRTDLICRDLVGAHRKLVQRVMQFEEIKTIRR